jgi:hypothetical protein
MICADVSISIGKDGGRLNAQVMTSLITTPGLTGLAEREGSRTSSGVLTPVLTAFQPAFFLPGPVDPPAGAGRFTT